jgi:hypothetical protein
MVAFDNTFLTLMLYPNAPLPRDARTGKPITRTKERLDYLVLTLEQKMEKILIPMPVLGEVLVLAGDIGPEYLAQLRRNVNFEFGNFDELAAIEFAASVAEAKRSGDKRRGSDKSWAKAKFDEQIVAICKVHRVSAIYSDDGDIARLCSHTAIKVISLQSLPEPPETQPALDFGEPPQ